MALKFIKGDVHDVTHLSDSVRKLLKHDVQIFVIKHVLHPTGHRLH